MKPTDTFFFRNHRDFEFGSSFIKGIFPPRLSTAYGALRSAFIYQHSNFHEFQEGSNEACKKWMGTPESIGEFSIKGVFLFDGEQVILPLPLDYQIIQNNDQTETATPLQLHRDSTPASNHSTYQLFGTKKEKSSSPVDGFISEEVFKEALLDYSKEFLIKRPSHWIITDPKIGIALDQKRRVTKESMLYNMEFLRFKKEYKDAGFLIAIHHGPSFQEVTNAKFGGEGKNWNLEETEAEVLSFTSEEKQKIVDQIKQTGIARIVLVTPALWKYGNRPSQWNKETNELEFENFTCPLLAVATSRPTVIGGWDIVNNRPKPRMNAVPAGTTLYVQVKEQDVERFVEQIFNEQLTDFNHHEGYGFAVCGASKITE